MILHNKFSNYYHPAQFRWRFASGSSVLYGQMQSEKRRDKIEIESIIMSADIRQRHQETEPYEAITSFFDQKEYDRRALCTISRSIDPA